MSDTCWRLVGILLATCWKDVGDLSDMCRTLIVSVSFNLKSLEDAPIIILNSPGSTTVSICLFNILNCSFEILKTTSRFEGFKPTLNPLNSHHWLGDG